MRVKIFLLIGWLLPVLAGAQDRKEAYCQSFDSIKQGKDKSEIEQDKNNIIRSLYAPTYTQGIFGQALDLTEQVPFRIPYVVETEKCPSYGENSSFSIQVWVKTLKGARQGTPIMSNKKVANMDSIGWCIGTRESGSWYWNISDGKTTYTYEPTKERQAINDGEWHQIVVSVDRDKEEMWMYMDGKNVAIYRLETRTPQGTKNLGNVTSSLQTVIGGSDEYGEPEHNYSRREWMAFNGKIDEVKIYPYSIGVQEVKTDYQKYKPLSSLTQTETPNRLKIQVWNIWHGGHRSGQHVGVARTAQILKKENADIIGLIETYGSGDILADSLGYYYYLISDNLSIMSRYPILETVKIYQSFFSGGAILDLGNNRRIAFFDTWLYYANNERRHMEIKSILKEMDPFIKQADDVPVIMVGDFNTQSHLDVTTEEAASLPVTQEVATAGFGDSYREVHPDPKFSPGFTWTPLYNERAIIENGGSLKDYMRRIDYIFYKGKKLTPYNSEKIDHHAVFWPSDHASVVSLFYIDPVDR